MTRKLLWASSLSCAFLVAACGGGGSGGSSPPPPPPPAATNTLAVVVDAGPAGLTSQNRAAANMLYASVTLCTPGSASACNTIDHVQIDTQSYGLEILAEALSGGAATPTAIVDPTSGVPLRECVQFADGYTWGSMVVADVTIGTRSLRNLPVHLIGDTAAGQAPATCVSGGAENTVVQFGANGVLGVGVFLQDCGSFCETSVPPNGGGYYVCPNNVCQRTTVLVRNQQQNPIWLFASDNNGIVIQLPAVQAPGAASVSGTLYFGVGTQSNNGLGSAALMTVDGNADLFTVFNGTTLAGSFIDSGSNGYFFNSAVTPCSSKTSNGFYCPAASTRDSAAIQGQNGTMRTVNFTVDNADNLFSSPTLLTAFPNLAGPNNAPNAQASSFDWGLPFFFGQRVYVVFENSTVNGTPGPAVGF